MAKRIIVELRVPKGTKAEDIALLDVFKLRWFKIDREYKPVSAPPPETILKALEDAEEEIVLVRGEIQEGKEEELKSMPGVVSVWSDAKIAHF